MATLIERHVTPGYKGDVTTPSGVRFVTAGCNAARAGDASTSVAVITTDAVMARATAAARVEREPGSLWDKITFEPTF
jgi:hypothetical protein